MTSSPLLNGQHDHQFSPGVDATPPSMVGYSLLQHEEGTGLRHGKAPASPRSCAPSGRPRYAAAAAAALFQNTQ